MGYAMTWCAVPEQYADRFLQTLNLSPTGKTENSRDSLITTARLDTGWQILVYNKYGCPFLRESDLRCISADYEVLLCLIEEHVMASSAEVWSKGQRKWWISHEGENGPKGLSAEGELPEAFPAIRAEMEQTQLAEGGDDAGVDYIFEIPLQVAYSLAGFKHDEDCRRLVNNEYIVLSLPEPPKRSGGGILGWFKK